MCPSRRERALEHFFSPGNLTALRELALRRTAERVDEQLLTQMQAHAIPGPWAAGERVLVCVSEDPRAAGLVRYAKRLADRLHAPWTALVRREPAQPAARPRRSATASPTRCASPQRSAARRSPFRAATGASPTTSSPTRTPTTSRTSSSASRRARAGSRSCTARWCTTWCAAPAISASMSSPATSSPASRSRRRRVRTADVARVARSARLSWPRWPRSASRSASGSLIQPWRSASRTSIWCS